MFEAALDGFGSSSSRPWRTSCPACISRCFATSPNGAGIAQLFADAVVLMLFAWPLGAHMAAVYAGTARRAQVIGGPIERLIYKIGGINPADDMKWTRYGVLPGV
jgi:hypothetical protein